MAYKDPDVRREYSVSDTYALGHSHGMTLAKLTEAVRLQGDASDLELSVGARQLWDLANQDIAFRGPVWQDGRLIELMGLKICGPSDDSLELKGGLRRCILTGRNCTKRFAVAIYCAEEQ